MCCNHHDEGYASEDRHTGSSNFPTGRAFKHPGLATAADYVDEISDDLRSLSQKLHQNPELGFEEHIAHDALTEYMQNAGFKVTRKAYGLDTAWRATFENGTNGPVIGVNSEMDALPDLGHACGHNLIAIAGVGTALAMSKAMLKHNLSGKVILLGTPAEEGGGGKIVLLEAGAYDEMDMCMMAHPTPSNAFTPMFARAQATFDFSGHPAHAALSPEQGLNALDACVIAYNSISMLRQQSQSNVRIHLNIITYNHPINVIPASATLSVSCRALDMEEFKRIIQRIKDCAHAGAKAAGCEVKESWDRKYQTLVNNVPLANEYALYMDTQQSERVVWSETPTASTDFGNISHVIPCIHPNYKIPTDSKSQNHTLGFTKSAGTEEAHAATIKAMKGLAAVGCRALVDSAFLEQVQTSFKERAEDKGESENGDA